MRVALLQYPIVWADPVQNLAAAEAHIRALKGQADVAMLPEMFSTGFCTDRPDLAEAEDGPTMQALQRLADETDLAITGSIIARREDGLYNSGFFLRPGEAPVFIRKRHLYAHGGENRFFRAGNEQTVIHWRGARFRLIICYDLRFPVWSRNRKSDPYDVLLVVACWPQVRIGFWDALLPARATENQCYVCAVNMVGEDGLGLHYNGHSRALNTQLQDMAGFTDDEEGTRIVTLDMPLLQHFREKLPLWQDGDEFEIND